MGDERTKVFLVDGPIEKKQLPPVLPEQSVFLRRGASKSFGIHKKDFIGKPYGEEVRMTTKN